MNKLAILLIVIGSLVSGCVPYYASPSPNGGGAVNHSERHYGGHDRDGDGVPNRQDRRPNDPHRY